MQDLLESIMKTHDDLEQCNRVRSGTVSFDCYGCLLDLEGYPVHPKLTGWSGITSPLGLIQHLEPGDDRWKSIPRRVWIDPPDGFAVGGYSEPGSAFAGHKTAERAVRAGWTGEAPFDAAFSIKDHPALYTDRFGSVVEHAAV
jgi:hypothetical protein